MTPQETFDICGVRMILGSFSTHDVQTISNGGELFILVRPIFYHALDGRLFQIPRGAHSDGISAPRFANALGRTAGGNDWPSAWFHDSSYRNQLLVWDSGLWKNAKQSQEEADSFLKECALACGDTAVEAETLYQAVRLFGKRAFDADR